MAAVGMVTAAAMDTAMQLRALPSPWALVLTTDHRFAAAMVMAAMDTVALVTVGSGSVVTEIIIQPRCIGMATTTIFSRAIFILEAGAKLLKI